MAQTTSVSGENKKSNSIADVLNYFPLGSKIGTAGQPTAEQFEFFKAQNYSAVINLAMDDSANALTNEAEIISALDMSYQHIPVPWNAPNAFHVKEFFEAMDKLVQQERPILVHCAANYRASVFTYKYLTLKKGLSKEAATTPLLKKWLPQMDDNWRKIMALNLSDIE